MAVFHVAGHGDFQWDRKEFTLAEGILLEDATGRLFDELVTLYNAQRRAGAAAFAWLAMRRNGVVTVPFREFVAGLTVNSLRESFDDETPADQGKDADGGEGQGADAGEAADPPARPAAARRRAPTRRTDSAPKKAVSATR